MPFLLPSRRRLLRTGLGSSLALAAGGCLDVAKLQPACPVHFAASIVSPVFYGYRDYTSPQVRVFYPSLDGSPAGASILSGCERYPVALIIHGDCPGDDPFSAWFLIASQLARTGYIVAVMPGALQTEAGDSTDLSPYIQVYRWLRARDGWEFHERSYTPASPVLIGHSFGVSVCAVLAAKVGATAFVSLSGELQERQDLIQGLQQVGCPVLFMWGAFESDDLSLGAQIFSGSSLPTSGPWTWIPTPKHAVQFLRGHHGDYFPPSGGPYCGDSTLGRGACTHVPQLAADWITAFISKYASPEFAIIAPSFVPNSLVMTPDKLPSKTPEEAFYAGGYLSGFAVSRTAADVFRQAGCQQYALWDLGAGPGGMWVAQDVAGQ